MPAIENPHPLTHHAISPLMPAPSAASLLARAWERAAWDDVRRLMSFPLKGPYVAPVAAAAKRAAAASASPAATLLRLWTMMSMVPAGGAWAGAAWALLHGGDPVPRVGPALPAHPGVGPFAGLKVLRRIGALPSHLLSRTAVAIGAAARAVAGLHLLDRLTTLASAIGSASNALLVSAASALARLRVLDRISSVGAFVGARALSGSHALLASATSALARLHIIDRLAVFSSYVLTQVCAPPVHVSHLSTCHTLSCPRVTPRAHVSHPVHVSHRVSLPVHVSHHVSLPVHVSPFSPRICSPRL